MIDLPTDLLRSFVAVVEAGTLERAALRVGRSPSAISLQMKKLQALGRARLFDRQGRSLVLTPAGHTLAAHARVILSHHRAAADALTGGVGAGRARIGLVQDMASAVLGPVLKQMRDAEPDAQIGVQVGRSTDLVRALGEDRIDVAICVRGAAGPVLHTASMVWIGDAEMAACPIVPLVLVSEPCPFWDAAHQALVARGRDYRIALETPSLEGVRAAVLAGLGVGCRTRQFAGTDLPVLGPDSGLPPLPDIAYTVLRRTRPSRAAARLGDFAEAALQGLA